MKTFKVPVIIEEHGVIEVQAESLAYAVYDVFKKGLMPETTERIAGSMTVDEEGLELHNTLTDEEWDEYNNSIIVEDA